MSLLEAVLALSVLGLSAVGYFRVFRSVSAQTENAEAWVDAVAGVDAAMQGGLAALEEEGLPEVGSRTNARLAVEPWSPLVDDMVVTVRLPGGQELRVHRLVKEPRARRGGFTLIEVSVALTITALVASLAWVVLDVGYETGDRVRAGTAALTSETATRELVSAALRYADPGIRGGDTVFLLARTADGTRQHLAFVSRGLEEPYGGSRTWMVNLEAGAAGLRLDAVPVEAAEGAIHAELTSAGGAGISVSDGANPGTWLTSWRRADVAPAVVRIQFLSSSPNKAPIVARIAGASVR